MSHITDIHTNHPSEEYLVFPDGSRHLIPDPMNEVSFRHTDHPTNTKGARPYHVNRNKKTGHIVMPLLGTRWDDLFLAAVTKGTISNSGFSPVVDGEASNLIRRLQMMVYDWVVSYKSSFTSPMIRTANLFAEAEDGEGIQKFMSWMTGSLLSQNSGFFYSRLPLHLPIDDWADFGAELIPIRNDKGEETGNFSLQIGARSFTQNRGLWALDNLLCDPTGNAEWPFRILKEGVWVLVHKNHGRQILGEIGNKQYNTAGFWSCPLYIYFGEMGIMNAMVSEYNFEGFLNAPPQGMVVMTHADTDKTLSNIIAEWQTEREKQESLYYEGVAWVSMKSKDGKVFFVPFKKPSEGFSQEEFIRLKHRRLALAFALSLNFVTLEIGVGAVHQAQVADMLSEITGVAWVRNKLEHLFNHIEAPKRVKVAVSIPSSAAKQQEAQVFSTVSTGVKTLQDAGAGMSPNQIKLTVEKFTGQILPVDSGEISADHNDDVVDIVEAEPERLVDNPEAIRVGTKVRTVLGAYGVIVGILSGSEVLVEHPWDREIKPPSSHAYAMDELFLG